MSARGSSDETEQLANLVLDGVANEADQLRLCELLRADEAARRTYVRCMALHATLTSDYVTAIVPAEQSQQPMPVKSRSIRAWAPFVGLALGLTLVAGLLTYWSVTGRVEPILTLESVTGSATWSDSHLVQRSGLTAGAMLAEGTLSLEGEQASATARYADGTVLTLSGGTEVAFSAGEQKRLMLRQGTLTATVEPQPAGRPLVIRTTTALVEVRGTVFSLSAERQRTTVSVESGAVIFKRLADGEQIDVPARHAAWASINATRKLTARKFDPPPVNWRYEYRQPPPATWRGRWVDHGAGETPFVEAVPGIYHRKIDDTMVVQYVVSARAQEGRLVTLKPNSFVRVRYRLATPAPLKIFLSIQKPNGAFGGNFEASRSAEDSAADGQWQWMSIPVSDFPAVPALAQQHPKLPDGAQVFLVMVSTPEADARLQVAELVIDEGP